MLFKTIIRPKELKFQRCVSALLKVAPPKFKTVTSETPARDKLYPDCWRTLPSKPPTANDLILVWPYMPSAKRRAGAPATFADLSATSPFPARPPCLRKPVGEGASLHLDAGRRMEQREKRSQVSSVSTEGQITGGGRLRQEALEEGSVGLTIINGSEIAAQFENSKDYRHLCCMSEELLSWS